MRMGSEGARAAAARGTAATRVRRETGNAYTPLETAIATAYGPWMGGRVLRRTPHWARTGTLPEPWAWWEER